MSLTEPKLSLSKLFSVDFVFYVSTPLAPKAHCAFSSSTNPNNYTITALFHLLLSSYRLRTSIFFSYKEKAIVTPGHNMPSKTLSFLSPLST